MSEHAFANSARSVQSEDDTKISYLTTGQGPSVVAVPAALTSASDYLQFAVALGRTYTVHVIDRRGRGLSGPQGGDYGMAKECADVAAVIAATGSTRLFGHSYGGLVALETARRETVLSKVAVYEPAVSVDGSIDTSWVPACRRCLEGGRALEAFAIVSIEAGPRSFQWMPVWLMKLLLPRFVKQESLTKMLGLLPTAVSEYLVTADLDSTFGNYESIAADVLLMSGGKTYQDWVSPALERLLDVIPSAKPHVFPKLDHYGPVQGEPTAVAEAITAHFGDR